MDVLDFIEPELITLEVKGATRKFYLSKYPATDGREIVAKYPLSSMPKIGEYAVSEEVMLKNMAFVAVEIEPGRHMALNSKQLINSHVGGFENLMRLEWANLHYNCSFLQGGANSAFFATIKASIPPSISRMLTALSEQLSQAAKQPSGSSNTDTH